MEGRREMGPAESSSNGTSGAWRLLIWGPLVILAIASGFVSPSSWGGLVALWGWAPLVAGLAAVWAVVEAPAAAATLDETPTPSLSPS